MMRIGIIGGGINGLATAWVLAKQGHDVSLYERHKLLGATSSASSKLLHGGIRYLENFEFRLVRESLRERDAWFKRVPELAKPIPMVMPVYQTGRRSRFILGAGFFLYGQLSGKSALPRARWLDVEEVLGRSPELISESLLGGYAFYDGQMQDRALGLWVADRARDLGVQFHEGHEVAQVDGNGRVTLAGGTKLYFDRIVNAAGPWAIDLLGRSGISSRYQLDLVRGSHLVLAERCQQALLLEVPGERRIFFVLPYEGNTLVGTTEVRQHISEPVRCTSDERSYLLVAYRHYFPNSTARVVHDFAGLRPLIRSSDAPQAASRDYAVECNGKLLTLLGGKWTTSIALARKVGKMVC
jgi:glycerol-3-phosphate dehydrogenase